MMASDVCFKCGADVLRGSPRCLSCGAAMRTTAAASGREFHPLRIVGYVCATLIFVMVMFHWVFPVF